MKIRTSLILLSLFLIVAAAAIGLVNFQALNRTTAGFDETIGANQMIKDLFELNIITLEYFIHDEERMKEQWQRKFQTLGKIIRQKSLDLTHTKDAFVIRSIAVNYEALGRIFDRLQDTLTSRKKLEAMDASPVKTARALELEERLLAAMLIDGQSMTAGALRLFELTKEEMANITGQTNRIIIFGFIGLIVFLSVVSFFIIRSITAPLNDLAKSTEIFGKGDLNHRTALQTQNEIGRLGIAFNQMAEKLMNTTVSRNELVKEVDERKRVETALRYSKDRLLALFDGISDPLIMLSREGLVLMLNRSAGDYFGIRLQDGPGNICYRSLMKRSEPCEGCRILPAVLTDERVSFERKGIMNDKRVEQVSLYPVSGKEKEDMAVIVHISDVTEQKTAQKRLIQNEKLLSMGLLVSGIAHEMNNPNSFISLNVPILKEYFEEIIPIVDEYAGTHQDFNPFYMSYPEFREDFFKLIGNIEHGSVRINQIVSRLRGLVTHQEEVRLKQVPLKEVIDNALDLCRARALKLSKTLELHVPQHLPVIRTDPVILEQVLSNVLINAVQATEGDSAWVKIKVSRNAEENGHVIIEVMDKGCGMEESVEKKVFEPFFTTKPPDAGSGLGLYVCQSLIGALNGHMEVESEPGKGSLFRIVMPEHTENPGVENHGKPHTGRG